MLGLMQYHPYRVSSLLEHAAKAHGKAATVSRAPAGPVHRSTFADIEKRAKQVANALIALGVEEGERVCHTGVAPWACRMQLRSLAAGRLLVRGGRS
jgi:acyl-CoA synthetase (AMP-forming)/AMP-acid ligase II